MYAANKRLVVFCDGTAQDGLIATDNGIALGGGTALYYTNVLRLSRAVKPVHKGWLGQNVLQIVFYQSGVGADSDFSGHASSSDLALELFGTAVARKIRDCYAFLSQNYNPGDEIFIFGFSRGAYTARKVAGLVDRIGLLELKDMGKFYPWCYALESGKGEQPPRPATPVPISVLGVWDTVGSLRTSILQPWPGLVNQLGISDALLPANVKVALHAMAMQENRNWFQVTPFELPDESKMSAAEAAQRKNQVLKQVWFGGEHSDCGGGWDSHELADIALMWMASEVSPYLDIDEDLLLSAIRPHTQKPAWGESIPHNSYENTAESLAIVGRIEPSTRLQGGHIVHDSVFHASVLNAPRPSEDPASAAKQDVKGAGTNKKDAGKQKADIKTTIREALGKYMVTLDDLHAKFGAAWQPQVTTLNPLEERARALWNTQANNANAPTFESAEQTKMLSEHKPAEAVAAGKD